MNGLRTIDELIASANAVLDRAYYAGAYESIPLFSGGHDSLCAVHLASQHKSFKGKVYQINTTIGAKYTREFSQRVCDKFGWELVIGTSNISYEKFVTLNGFPGPAGHAYVYRFLKERVIRQWTKGKAWRMLVNGARQQESVRRMGHVEPVTFGELVAGKRVNKKRVWTAPCFNWSKVEQAAYMDEFGLPVNKLKVALGMSGECACGAFAAPGELAMWRQYAPDVAAEIDRLTVIAIQNNKPCIWGERPTGEIIQVPPTGPLCSSCDMRASAAGIEIA